MKSKKRSLILLLTLALLIVSAGLTAAAMIPSADDLLTQSIETLETVTSGHAVVDIAVDTPEMALNATVELWGKLDAGPNGEPALRAVVLSASESEWAGLTAVTDGSRFWLYDPNSNTVVTGTAAELAPIVAEQMAARGEGWAHEGDQAAGEYDPEAMALPQTPAEAVAKLLEYVTAERSGSQTVAGENAYQLRLVPIPEQMPDELRAVGGYVNVWLRSGDQLPLGAAYVEGAMGSGSVMASVAEINLALDESLFTFEIPAGATVINAADLAAEMLSQAETAVPAAPFEPLTPATLPEAARQAETSQIRGATVQRYTLPEGRSFVVAQGPALPVDVPADATTTDSVIVRGIEGTLYSNDDGTRTLLSWSEGEFSFWIGGDLSPEQALAVAESLR